MESWDLDSKNFQECTFRIALPLKIIIVGRIIWKLHLEHKHAGMQKPLVVLKETVWIINCASTNNFSCRSYERCSLLATLILVLGIPNLIQVFFLLFRLPNHQKRILAIFLLGSTTKIWSAINILYMISTLKIEWHCTGMGNLLPVCGSYVALPVIYRNK